eukprot:1160619-Pelagomonas_calceolata.AAC.2
MPDSGVGPLQALLSLQTPEFVLKLYNCHLLPLRQSFMFFALVLRSGDDKMAKIRSEAWSQLFCFSKAALVDRWKRARLQSI